MSSLSCPKSQKKTGSPTSISVASNSSVRGLCGHLPSPCWSCVSRVLRRSWADYHNSWEFTRATSLLSLQRVSWLVIYCLWFLNPSSPSSSVILESWENRYDTDVPFRAAHSKISYYWHVDRLWISVLIVIYFRRSPSHKGWEILSCGYRNKSLGFSLCVHLAG